MAVEENFRNLGGGDLSKSDLFRDGGYVYLVWEGKVGKGVFG